MKRRQRQVWARPPLVQKKTKERRWREGSAKFEQGPYQHQDKEKLKMLKCCERRPSEGSLKTRTVLFVDQTRDGQLAKDLRQFLSRLESILGFRIKVVERTGTTTKNTLPNTNPWAGDDCGREDCITCRQESEEKPPCMKRGLVYENICLDCNPWAAKPGPLRSEDLNKETPSLYVGEMARL